MTDKHVFIRDLGEHARVPERGILSQTLQDDGRTKVILFSFAPDQELSAHTAPFPAILTFVAGEATVTLGGVAQEAAAGSFVYMPPLLEHGVKAKTALVMLLTIVKNPAAAG